MLVKIEMDTSYLVVDPQLFGKYVVFEVFTFRNNNENDGLLPNQILVFDIHNQKLLQRKYRKNYRFRFESISDENMIYSYTGDAEYGFEYDTFKITSMELMSSSN